MNSAKKFRFHMGCGEPLCCRWWVALTARNRLTNVRGAEGPRVPGTAAQTVRGDKCKS
ncbi:MAG: hypothetical protein RQ736_09025 [Thiogranum sp.]|nr:hypothetical protein [Thiogranum sp.]